MLEERGQQNVCVTNVTGLSHACFVLIFTQHTLRAEATFLLCELSCEKQPLPTTIQFSILDARNSSHDSQVKLIVRSVIKWRKFRGNKKIVFTLICYTRFTQDSHNALNRSRTGKNPFFLFICPDFQTDLNGCRQRLLFAHQLTQ